MDSILDGEEDRPEARATRAQNAMDFLTAAAYVAILALALLNAWLVSRRKLDIRGEDEE